MQTYDSVSGKVFETPNGIRVARAAWAELQTDIEDDELLRRARSAPVLSESDPEDEGLDDDEDDELDSTIDTLDPDEEDADLDTDESEEEDEDDETCEHGFGLDEDCPDCDGEDGDLDDDLADLDSDEDFEDEE